MTDVRVAVNGARRTVDGDTPIRALVAQLTPAPSGIAVALNGTVVPRSEWDACRLRDGDVVEIVTAVQGG